MRSRTRKFNLNLPRYIDAQEDEDIQDIEGHLRGGIPARDIDALQSYWDVCPALRKILFTDNRPKYLDLAVTKDTIKNTIYEHPEFTAFIDEMEALYTDWQQRGVTRLKTLETDCHPKEIIKDLSEDLLDHYKAKPLIDAYDVYQHLMDYWAEIMQDDCYLIAVDGWKAETYRVLVKDKKGKEKDKGWICDLVPKPLIVARYFADEQQAIKELETELETVTNQMSELEEEHGGEDGAFAELEKINKGNINACLKEIKGDADSANEEAVLKQWIKLSNQLAVAKKAINTAEAELDELAYNKYPELSEDEIKTLVVDDKWMATIGAAIDGEMDRVSQVLTARVKELVERYETPLPRQSEAVADLELKVDAHLKRMGFSW